jgi:1-acyl-sn-glycerol-3-phosphate acyltransferase
VILYRVGQGLIRAATPLLARLEIRGRENVPKRGPFLLVANHQSYLDPPLIQAVLWRPIYTMAKSTQFSDRLTGALLRRVHTFPVRRFEVDPQAVRIVLRHLESGDAVGLYVEGERSWDGRLQPPRLGALRLILKAGVPVVPCGISGAYDIWPRWDRRLRRGRIRIAFGEPLRFPQIDARADRERALPDVAARLMAAIGALSGAERAPVRTE